MVRLLFTLILALACLSPMAFAQRVTPEAGEGLVVTPYVTSVGNITVLLYDQESRDVLALDTDRGRVLRLRDRDSDGTLDLKSTYASHFTAPTGMALSGGMLYIADTRGVWKLPFTQSLASTQPPQLLADLSKLPEKATGRKLAVLPDGKSLLLSIGVTGDRSEVAPPLASLLTIDTVTGRAKIYARGLRDITALSVSEGGKIAALVNETQPAFDYLAMVESEGFYGYPYAHGNAQPIAGLARKAPYKAASMRAPLAMFEGDGLGETLLMPWDAARLKTFPKTYDGRALIIFRAPNPRIEAVDLAGLAFENDSAQPLSVLGGFTGFRGHVYGAPSAMGIDHAGGLLVADGQNGMIWRISAAPILKVMPDIEEEPEPEDNSDPAEDETPPSLLPEETVEEEPLKFRRGGTRPQAARRAKPEN